MTSRERLAHARLPEYGLFRSVCHSGLHAVRPLKESAESSDSWGWNYGSGWPPSYSAYGRMRALIALADAMALQPKSVLEIAAGDAALCASLATQGCQVAANDLRKENLENAVGHFHNASNIRLLPGNLFELDPAVVGLHDLVIACEIVEHVAHTVDFLKQLKRFVAPGGHILLTTPNGSYFRNTLPTHSMIQDFTALESQEFKPDADGHLFLITPEEMLDLADRAGLTVERLSLWGTPFITGHAGISKLGPTLTCRLCHSLERSMQKFPLAIKARLCFSMSLVLGL
jgi:2-polyprenyl-6-hydroxyphenyl methylase/3-demethylubiquinone-9 3-methyltransferase